MPGFYFGGDRLWFSCLFGRWLFGLSDLQGRRAGFLQALLAKGLKSFVGGEGVLSWLQSGSRLPGSL